MTRVATSAVRVLCRRIARTRAKASRDDSGQIIIIAVILMALLATLGPVVVSSETSDAPLVVQSTNRHSALAAAEAGIQWYRNQLDTNPNYFQYSATNNLLGDPALVPGGWCSSACDLGGTSPSEAFHYAADDSSLFAVSGASAGQLLLTVTVTGRAGSPGSYAYVTAQARFETTSLSDNAYFSDYEVLDPNAPTAQGFQVTVTAPDGSQTSEFETAYTVPGTNQTLWSALCLYRSFDPNTFVDTLGAGGQGPTPPGGLGFGNYSSADPYYGAYFGSSFSFTASGDTITVPGEPWRSTWSDVRLRIGRELRGPGVHVGPAPRVRLAPVPRWVRVTELAQLRRTVRSPVRVRRPRLCPGDHGELRDEWAVPGVADRIVGARGMDGRP